MTKTTVLTDELTHSGLTVEQCDAIRRYCDRRERELITHLGTCEMFGRPFAQRGSKRPAVPFTLGPADR